MREFIPIMRELLIRPVLAIFGDCVGQKIPAPLRPLQIVGRRLRKLLSEQRRGSALRQRRHRRRCRRRVLRPHHLRIAPLGQYVVLILTVARIDQKVKTPVGVLQLRQKVRLPFRLFQQIALAIPAFRDAQIVQLPHPAERVHRENQIMNQRRAVDRVLAVIPGVMMAAGDIDWPFVHEWIELGRLVGQPPRRLRGIVRIELHGVVGNRVPGEREGGGG